MSPKSLLDPLEVVGFLGKSVNLSARRIASHPHALLQLSVGWILIAVGGGGGEIPPPPQLSWVAQLPCPAARLGLPLCGGGMVLAAVGKVGEWGQATQSGTAPQSLA